MAFSAEKKKKKKQSSRVFQRKEVKFQLFILGWKT